MGITSEYFEFQKKYEAQYGERTVVIMQVGTFYEIWEYSVEYCTSDEAKMDEHGKIQNENVGHAIALSTVLNCVLTFEKPGDTYSYNKNPHKVGFPMVAIEKNLATLMSSDYVVVRVDQEKGAKPAKGNVKRFVAEICSPTMEMDRITLDRPTSNIVCIYVEYQRGTGNKYENFLVTTGAAVIDIITGQNRICEFYSKVEDQIHAIQELYRFLISHYPRELIIHVGDMPKGLTEHSQENLNPYIKYLEKVLELRRFDRLSTFVNGVPADYKKLPYQVEFLNKVFTKQVQNQGIQLDIIQKRNDRIIEELGLERVTYGRIAYILLMQHCHSHNPDIISKISTPDLKWIDEHKHLILTHNAITQLDLIPVKDSNIRSRKKTEIDSLMSILDHNQTNLGKRVLNTLLQNPMLEAGDIQTYYDMVDDMSVNVNDDEPLWVVLDRMLKELPDIGRLQRKLEIKLITPRELSILYKSYFKIINIYITILKIKTPTLHKQMFAQEDITNFNSFISRFASIIDFDALECCHTDTSAESNFKWLEFIDCPIKSGVCIDLDEQSQSLVAAETNLQQIVDHLNGFLSHTKGKKIEFKAAKKKQGATKKDPSGTLLSTTAAKAGSLQNAPINTMLCGNIQILPYTSADRIITSDKIGQLCSHIDNVKMWMRRRLLSIYESILEEMVTKYTFYVPVAALVAKLDLVHSYAKVSHLYNYHRPEIVNDEGPSYLEAKDLRHPIIERIIDGAYVTNDILLGNGIATDISEIGRTNGMLCYGTNSAGKTSMAKAVALAIIMAQIGCFVPAKLKYKPYSKIITRLTGNDNLFKGESTFVVEMLELRTILRQADSSTLVVGNEIASGSESHSGTAITCSAIVSLVGKQATFLFATHLHEIIDLSCITNLPRENLNICHLSISYDDRADLLIYDRKLKNGSGPSIYGLMVAKSLNLPDEFLDRANLILLEILGENKDIIPTNKSRYNAKVYVDACRMCGKTRNQTSVETHHIQEQSKADERKLIGNMHMNIKNNLIPLCRACHANLHGTDTELETMATSNGSLVRVKA